MALATVLTESIARRAANSTRARAHEVTVIFVCEIFDGPRVDVSVLGIDHRVQSYTSSNLQEIKNGFESEGFHFLHFGSHEEFIGAVLSGELRKKSREVMVVFPHAEEGLGAGRHALLPSFCELNGLAHSGPGPHGCSIARHKYHAFSVLRESGVRVPDTWMFSAQHGWSAGISPPVGRKVIIKPAYESTCIGIDEDSVLVVQKDFNLEIERRALKFRQPVVAQDFIEGFEVGIPLLELDQVYSLPPVGFEIDGYPKFLKKPKTFREEAVLGLAKNYHFVPEFPSEISQLQDVGLSAFIAMDMAGIARFDVRVDREGVAWVFDTNEMPPALSASSYALSLGELGLSYGDMLTLWVASALRNDGKGQAN